jgi:pyruvate/2-oxoacid:ferredoxin oxidoreductase beta subunit
MSQHGKKFGGKQERRKEIAQIAMMHPRTFVAQTTCAHVNHFYRSVLEAMGIRWTGDHLLLYYLPTGAWRRRQYGD